MGIALWLGMDLVLGMMYVFADINVKWLLSSYSYCDLIPVRDSYNS